MSIVAGVLMVLGAALAVLAGLGLVRFPDVLTRLQAATKLQVPGLALVLIGAALAAEHGSDVALLLLVAVFQTITVPVLGMIVGRAAYRTGDVRTELVEGDHPYGNRPRGDDGAREQGGGS